MTDAQALAELKKDVASSERLRSLLRQVCEAEAKKLNSQVRGIFDYAAMNRKLGQAEGVEDLLNKLLPQDGRDRTA
jgi:hypothetical protein